MEWKSEEYLGLRPDSHDWARLAAYIDGEGSINLTPRRTNTGKSMTYCAKVVVTNTDFRLAKWCLDTFGMKFYSHSNNSLPASRNQNWALCVYAQACGYKAAWILRNCLPWFVLKMAQAEVVLAHQETIGPDVWQRGPGLTTPDDILHLRAELKQQLLQLNKRGRDSAIDVKVAVEE
jgi:hypothetical protein